jgi:L-fuculose-phosphate aldolase
MPFDDLTADVATACRILEAQGHEHSFLGHVSGRSPGARLMQVKPSAIGLGEVDPSDVLTVGLDGELVAGSRPMHAEMPIHTEIYKRRPEANAVVHTHPLHVAAFTAAASEFQMVNQDSVLFSDGIGFYPSPTLVVTAEQGKVLADALGDKRALVMKNHGLVTVGATVQEAVFLAVAFVNSLRVQVLAAQFGPISCISAAEAQEMALHFASSYERRVTSSWEYLKRTLPGRR